MIAVKSVKGWAKPLIEFIKDLLVPEDVRVCKLLNLSAGTMRDLLPKSPVYMKDVFVLFDYQNKAVRFIVKCIKYKNNANLRKRLAVYLYEEILSISSDIVLFEGIPPLLIPMPMSKTEKRKRGFNQCEELAGEIKKLGGANIKISYNVLKKIKETERQTSLNREKRAENVKESMTATPINNRPVGSRTVIVLDDVYTTGASFLEARRALFAAGFRRVIGLFVAH